MILPSMVPLMQGIGLAEKSIPFSTRGYPGGCIAFFANLFLTTNREDEIEMKSSAD